MPKKKNPLIFIIVFLSCLAILIEDY